MWCGNWLGRWWQGEYREWRKDTDTDASHHTSQLWWRAEYSCVSVWACISRSTCYQPTSITHSPPLVSSAYMYSFLSAVYLHPLLALIFCLTINSFTSFVNQFLCSGIVDNFCTAQLLAWWTCLVDWQTVGWIGNNLFFPTSVVVQVEQLVRFVCMCVLTIIVELNNFLT